MPSFFSSTSSKSSSKGNAQVFAGLDDPFNFPTAKMRYTSRSTSPVSTTDSGYGSIDDDSPLSPKAQVFAKNRRRLQKDGKGHWRMHSYEYQSEENDRTAEKQPILIDETREVDNKRVWKPDPKRTFTAICNDRPRKEKWYTKRIYVKALEQKDRNEGLTDLQRSMAPVLRRPETMAENGLTKERPGRPRWVRKESTLLHPSPPPPAAGAGAAAAVAAAPPHTKRSSERSNASEAERRASAEKERGRKPSSLLCSDQPLSRSPSTLSEALFEHRSLSACPLSACSGSGCSGSGCSGSNCSISLRSPRNRSPTPLGIPMSSERQPAPTPLRIQIGSRKGSVLHSSFSDDESDDDDHSHDDGEAGELCVGADAVHDEEDVDDAGSLKGVSDDEDARSVSSIESAVGGACGANGVILARTALVARAQRVKVRSPGLKKSVEGDEV